MGSRKRVYKAGEVVFILIRSYGFRERSQKGSHLKLVDDEGRVVIVPIHTKDLPQGTLRSILRQAGLNLEDLD